MAIVPVEVNRPVNVPSQISERQLSAPVRVTTDVVLLVSKWTSVAASGTDAPPAPPDVADQCVVSADVHDPLPPTQ